MIYDEENDDYEYDYHDIVDDVDFIDDETYDDTDEPWVGTDADENEVMDNIGWENYYHNITDELIDDWSLFWTDAAWWDKYSILSFLSL